MSHLLLTCEAVAAKIDVKRRWLGEQGRRVSLCCGELPVAQRWKLAVSLQASESLWPLLHGGRGPAYRHERYRFTFRHTRRTVLMAVSMMLVQASERRSSFGKPSRVT
jgi:hypothetical protein